MLVAALGLVAFAPSAHAAITFAEPAAEYAAPHFPWSVALGDLNEDTKPDIVLTSQDPGGADPDGIVSVYINRGDGTFESKVDYTATGCKSAHGTAVGDFDGDQNLDVVTACRFGGLATFRGNGNGTLQTVDFEAGRGAGTFIGAAQLDGAGSHELVYTSLAFAAPGAPPPTPTLCRNSYNGTWTAADPCSDPSGPNPAFAGGPIVAADFTGDGSDEILSGSDAGSGVRSFRPAAGREWSWEDRATGNTGTLEYVATDLQADTDIDVIAAGTDASNAGRFAVLISDFKGGGVFGGIPAGRQPAEYPSVYPEEAGAGDFDGDSLNDVMVLSSIDDNGDGPGDGLAYHGNPDGTLRAAETFEHPFNGSRLTLATGDLNGDGKADAVICGTAGTQPPNLRDVCAVEIATGSAPPANAGPIGERPPGDPGGPQLPQLELTRITSGPSGVTPSLPTFTFDSPLLGAAATFQCRFDDREFKPCTSPHSGYNLAKGAHTFEVRAVDGAGDPDSTPAKRTFELGTVTSNYSCTLLIPWDYRVRSPGADGLFCDAVRTTCPAGSQCSLSIAGRVTDSDKEVAWGLGASVATSSTGTTFAWCESPTYKKWFDPLGAVFNPCPARASTSVVGPSNFVRAACYALYYSSGQAVRGPDDERVITCNATLRISPASTLVGLAGNGPAFGLFAPSAGTLTVAPTGSGSARAAGTRRRKRPKPPFSTVRVRPREAGPVTVKLKLSPAAKKTFKRKHALKLPMKLTFVAADGTRTVKTQKLTIKQSPPQPKFPRTRRP